MRRARLAQYSIWQFRDYVYERGLPTLVVALLMFFPLIVGMRALRRAQGAGAEPAAMQAPVISTLVTFGYLAVLIGVNGVISNDRKSGYYRFLFAKPVSLTRYYTQAFVVNWIGLMLFTLLVLVVTSAMISSPLTARMLLPACLAYISLGGIGFLLSASTRLDWVLLAGIFGLSQLLRVVFPASQSWYGRLLDVMLPPLHQLGSASEALARGVAVPHSTLVWLLAWGAGSFLLGLVVLRRRPLAR